MIKTFKEVGTFQSLYKAQEWLTEHGYKYGSLCRDQPVAITKGEYNLPEKYKNMTRMHKLMADGWMISTDFREGEVIINIINP